MKQSLLLGILLGLFLMACQKKDNPPANDANAALFSMWTSCGWCVGADSIKITEALTTYGSIRPCDTTDVFLEVNTSPQDYASLIALYDHEAFEKIVDKTGNLAADGCDQWVRVEKDGKSHTIWFENVLEDRLLPVRDFLLRLESIKQEME
jgi:hypothetical protein